MILARLRTYSIGVLLFTREQAESNSASLEHHGDRAAGCRGPNMAGGYRQPACSFVLARANYDVHGSCSHVGSITKIKREHHHPQRHRGNSIGHSRGQGAARNRGDSHRPGASARCVRCDSTRRANRNSRPRVGCACYERRSTDAASSATACCTATVARSVFIYDRGGQNIVTVPRFSHVAQWQSAGLITRKSQVRFLPWGFFPRTRPALRHHGKSAGLFSGNEGGCRSRPARNAGCVGRGVSVELATATMLGASSRCRPVAARVGEF